MLALQRDQIQTVCNDICNDCVEEIAKVTRIIQAQLKPFADVLESMWSMRRKATEIFEKCGNLNQLLGQVSLERSKLLRANTSVSPLDFVGGLIL